jgi:acyl phosphate:glycerol-3-phosphate acyltransferase
MINIEIIAGVLLAYLLGSIPTAVIVGKTFFGLDIRTVGSGNAGATNTIRIFGLKAGIPVLFFDVLKGFTAVKLSLFLNNPTFTENELEAYKIILGGAAVLGHVFPVFASFKGGKGVATIVGMLIALFPMAFLVILVSFIIMMFIWRIVSLSSIVCSILFPFIVIFIFNETSPPLIILAVSVAIFIPYTHRANIKRLLAGTEKKFDFGKNKIVK